MLFLSFLSSVVISSIIFLTLTTLLRAHTRCFLCPHTPCMIFPSLGQEDLDASNVHHVKACPYLPGTANQFCVSSRSSKLSLNLCDKEDGTGSGDNNPTKFTSDGTTPNVTQIKEFKGIDNVMGSPPSSKDINKTSPTYRSVAGATAHRFSLVEQSHHFISSPPVTSESCEYLPVSDRSSTPLKECHLVSCECSSLPYQSTWLRRQTSRFSLSKERGKIYEDESSPLRQHDHAIQSYNPNCSSLLSSAIPTTSQSFKESKVSSLQDLARRNTPSFPSSSYPCFSSPPTWIGIRAQNTQHHSINIFEHCKRQRDGNYYSDCGCEEWQHQERQMGNHFSQQIRSDQIRNASQDFSTIPFPEKNPNIKTNTNIDDTICDTNISQPPDVLLGAAATIRHKPSVCLNNDSGKHPPCEVRQSKLGISDSSNGLPIKTLEISMKESSNPSRLLVMVVEGYNLIDGDKDKIRQASEESHSHCAETIETLTKQVKDLEGTVVGLHNQLSRQEDEISPSQATTSSGVSSSSTNSSQSHLESYV